MSEFWYYAEGNETRGPIAFDQLVMLLSKLPTPKGVLVWRDGFDDWKAAENVREFAEKLIRPPPLPGTATVRSEATPKNMPKIVATDRKPLDIVAPSRKVDSDLSPDLPSTNLSPERPKRNWLHVVANIAAWAVAYGLSRLIGGNFWIPVLCIGISYWIFTKLRVQTSIAIMLAVSVGHALWIAAGIAILLSINKSNPDLVWFSVDIIAVTIAVIWCLKRQSVPSCVFVLLYELVGLSVNILDFNEISKANQAAAWMHVGLRVIACALAIYAIVNVRRQNRLIKGELALDA
jgi:hypothetical protein